MFRYRQRVERDLQKWQSNGWVTHDGAASILADLAKTQGGIGLAGVLTMLGAILVGFAAMSFVAANWEGMSRAARLALLAIGLWGSYGGAYWLFDRGHNAFAHAAVLTGCALFGASIMLIAQMYHMEGNPPDAVLMWGAGTLLAGGALMSPPASALAMALFCLWSSWEASLTHTAHWWFLPAWAATALTFAWQRWRPGLHISALALVGWISSLGYLLFKGQAHVLVAGVGVALALLFIVAGPVIDSYRKISEAGLGYSIALAYTGLFGWQFIQPIRNGTLLILALVTTALLVALVFHAWRRDQRSVLWMGYTAFSIEILGMYFKTIGTLLGTSLFFLLTGLLVLALAGIAVRLHKSQTVASPA